MGFYWKLQISEVTIRGPPPSNLIKSVGTPHEKAKVVPPLQNESELNKCAGYPHLVREDRNNVWYC